MQYQNTTLPDLECHALMDLEKKIHNSLLPTKFTGNFDLLLEEMELNFVFDQGHVIGLCIELVNLKSFPESIGNLTELRFIYLHDTPIQNLPLSFTQLKKLESFVEINNEEKYIKIDFLDKFSSFINLQVLKFDGNFWIYFPSTLDSLINLQEIYLDDCRYTTDYTIFQKREKSIENQILPDLSKYQNLRKLHLNFPPLTLPPSIFNLNNLVALSLSYSGISYKMNLDELIKIFKMTNLEELELIQCGLDVIPKEIGQLINLKKLNLTNNLLEELPETIIYCQKLEELYLVNFRPRFNLDFILKLSNIKYLDLVINSVALVPPKIKKFIENNALSE